MSRARDLALAVAALIAAAGAPAAAQPARGAPMAVPGLRNDQPISVSAERLEYDYKQNVVVYRGDVQAQQGDVRLRSDELTIRLVQPPGDGGATGASDPQAAAPAAALGGRVALREVIAAGHVRIDQGDRWATGGKAVFDQEKRILLLTEDPVLHDGPNSVAGERVVVYLDENRSVVEGGRRRVKAVLFPGSEQALGRDAEAAP